MIGKLAAKIFGTSNEREIKRILPLVEQINALEPQMQQLTDEQLHERVKTYLGAIDRPITAERWKALGPKAAPRREKADMVR